MPIESIISSTILQRLNQQTTVSEIGFLNGLAGKSFYYFYRSEIFNEEVSYDKAVALLHEVIDVLSNNPIQCSFYNGMAGIGWMITHLQEARIAAINIEDFLDPSVDLYLYEEMIDLLNRNRYDFFFGASGICYYFLKKYQNTQKKSSKRVYKRYIMHFLFYMEFLKKVDDNGIFWAHYDYPFKKENSCFQLSSISNVSSIILLLTEIANEKTFSSFCCLLLRKASNNLTNELETTHESRLDQAYCLWKTSILLNDPVLKKKAIQFLDIAKKKIKKEDISSLAKCTLIYMNVGKTLNDKSIMKIAMECFTKASNSLGKFPENDHSIWKGITGMGLIDFSLNYNISSNWSKCMLI